MERYKTLLCQSPAEAEGDVPRIHYQPDHANWAAATIVGQARSFVPDARQSAGTLPPPGPALLYGVHAPQMPSASQQPTSQQQGAVPLAASLRGLQRRRRFVLLGLTATTLVVVLLILCYFTRISSHDRAVDPKQMEAGYLIPGGDMDEASDDDEEDDDVEEDGQAASDAAELPARRDAAPPAATIDPLFQKL